MIKAELELIQGETRECGSDLNRVADLLDLCTGHYKTQLHYLHNSVHTDEITTESSVSM